MGWALDLRRRQMVTAIQKRQQTALQMSLQMWALLCRQLPIVQTRLPHRVLLHNQPSPIRRPNRLTSKDVELPIERNRKRLQQLQASCRARKG